MNIIIVPGFLGSSLTADQVLLDREIWLNYLAVAADGVPLMRLNDQGDGPAPYLPVRRWIPGAPLDSYYGTLIAFLARRHAVRAWGYDFRLSVLDAGASLAAFVKQQFPNDPVYLLGHSLGGIACRAAWKVLKGIDEQGRIARTVTLGTPHYGSLSVVRALGHLDPSYLLLQALVSGLRGLNPLAARDTLDRTLATWPAAAELLPFQRYGPLALSPATGQAVYSASTYAAYNPYVRQQRLDAALATQTWLQDAGDPSLTVTVQGTGVETAVNIADTSRLDQARGYGYSRVGDGQVPRAYGTWPGAYSGYVRGGKHFELPYHPVVLGAVEQLLAVGLAGDVVLG